MGRVDCMPAHEMAERVQSSGLQKVVDDLQKGKVRPASMSTPLHAVLSRNVPMATQVLHVFNELVTLGSLLKILIAMRNAYPETNPPGDKVCGDAFFVNVWPFPKEARLGAQCMASSQPNDRFTTIKYRTRRRGLRLLGASLRPNRRYWMLALRSPRAGTAQRGARRWLGWAAE